MIKAMGVSFGDGMTQIYAEPRRLEVFEVQRRAAARKKARRGMSAREMAIIASCLAPIVIGCIFATVMLPHTAAYITYWMITWSWCGFVMYANMRRRKAKR